MSGYIKSMCYTVIYLSSAKKGLAIWTKYQDIVLKQMAKNQSWWYVRHGVLIHEPIPG